MAISTRTPAQQARARRAFASDWAVKMKAVRKGDLCPGCGETENIQDNGEKGDERTWRCEECGCQWDRFIGQEG